MRLFEFCLSVAGDLQHEVHCALVGGAGARVDRQGVQVLQKNLDQALHVADQYEYRLDEPMIFSMMTNDECSGFHQQASVELCSTLAAFPWGKKNILVRTCCK